MKRILIAVFLILTAGQLAAEEENGAQDFGLYAGVGSGFMRFETDLASNGLLPGFGDTVDEDFNKTSLAGKLFVGFRLFRFTGIEVGYFKAFENDESYCFSDPNGQCAETVTLLTNNEPSTVDLVWNVDIPVNGYTVNLMGFLPLNDTFELVGKIGGVYTDLNATARETVVGLVQPADTSIVRAPNPPIATSVKEPGWDAAVGVGVNFNSPNHGFSVRAEFEWFNITEIDEPWIASLNALYAF